MKLLYDSTIFNIQKYGGISRYFTEIIPRIKNLNSTDVYIFRKLNCKPLALNSILLDLRFAINKFDIYHPTYYSFLVKRRASLKTVITVFDMIHELFLYNIPRHSEGIPTKKNSIMSADHIICISHTTKQDLKKIYNVRDEKITVIYLGAPKINKGQAIGTIRHQDKPYILYVGKRGLYKNFSVLLEAFSFLKEKGDIELVCFGGGLFTEEETATFKKMQLQRLIKYVSGIDTLLYTYYKNALAFVCPSLYEGFGLPVLEAMACGCPVIASACLALQEIADHAALFFPPQDYVVLANLIRVMLNDKNLRNEYIEKGGKRASQFSWEETARQTFCVYHKLLS